MDFKFKKSMVIVGVVVVAMLLLSIVLIPNFGDDNQAKTVPEDAREIPVPAPKPGERFTDFAETDVESRTAFLSDAAATYNITRDEFKNSEAITQECVANGTAKIKNRIRNDEVYANDYDTIDGDFTVLNENCYAKYSEFPYVAPNQRVLDDDDHDHGGM